MRLARELAERIVALRFDRLPRPAVDASRTAIVDTIGVTLAGSSEAAPRLVVSAEAASAASRLIARLETLASVPELTALLEPAARSDAVSKLHAQGRG